MPSAPVGRVAVVTGANKGIGFFIASQLASSGKNVIRNDTAVQKTIF